MIRWFHVESDGAGPANPCGTGASYPAGWRFMHSEVSGGLISCGNILKVEGYNNFAVTAENAGDGEESFCYLDAEVDKAAMNAFFSANANILNTYDQFELNDLIFSLGSGGYVKSVNDLMQQAKIRNISATPPTTINGALGLLKNTDPRTICIVIDYPGLPTVNQAFGVLRFPSSIGSDLFVWSGNNLDLIVRFIGPNQGYFYRGLRSAGTKLFMYTYDGTQPINRSGINLYWNGSTTPETPDGIYNSGSPSQQTISGIQLGANTSTDFYKEIDIFDHVLTTSEMEAVVECYQQKYTFS